MIDSSVRKTSAINHRIIGRFELNSDPREGKIKDFPVSERGQRRVKEFEIVSGNS